MAKKSTVTPIKVSLTFVKMAPDNLYTFGSAVYAGMLNNPAYPSPPVDMATLKSTLDGYQTLVTAALDGSKKVLVQRNHQGEALIKTLRNLAKYVEITCKDDMTTFTSSGFQVASKIRTATPPLSQSIRKIDSGSNSGQVLITLVAVLAALSYEIRWAPVPAASGTTPAATPQTWSSVLVPTAKTTTVSNLTPGHEL